MQSYRESHLNKGADYDESFHLIPHRAMMWRLEQRAIHSILERYKGGTVRHYLDFACGTGRVLAFVAPLAGEVVGIDISPSMLEVARHRAPGAEIICGDLTRQPLLQGRTFDVISAFRFFPNAEDELRTEALDCLVTKLAPNGLLIFNNHRNPRSSMRRVLSAIGRPDEEPVGSRLMSHKEAVSLVHGAGLRIIRKIPLGSLPMDEGRFVGPVRAIELWERFLSRLPGMYHLAQDTIYVCQRR